MENDQDEVDAVSCLFLELGLHPHLPVYWECGSVHMVEHSFPREELNSVRGRTPVTGLGLASGPRWTWVALYPWESSWGPAQS